jgi:hypothetical protein
MNSEYQPGLKQSNGKDNVVYTLLVELHTKPFTRFEGVALPHEIVVGPDYVKIGCQCHTWARWQKHGRAIALAAGLSAKAVQAYRKLLPIMVKERARLAKAPTALIRKVNAETNRLLKQAVLESNRLEAQLNNQK